MSYKIPKNLTKYSETFLWGLSFKQFLYLLLFTFLIYVVVSRLEIVLILKVLLIIPIVLLGFLLIYGKIDEKFAKKLQLKSSLRKVGYYDPKIEGFIPIKEVVDDVVMLKSGKMLAILEVLPIDFEILSDSEQEYILSVYSNWLRGLDYEVQITSRSVDLQLDSWISTIEKKISRENKSRFSEFKSWIKNFVVEERVRNRIFYVVIPLNAQIKTKKSFFQILGEWLLAIPQKSIDREDPAYKKALKNLEVRILNCTDTLKASQIKIRRLSTEELLGLYSSYFTNVSGGGKSYLTPIMWGVKD